MIQGRDIVCISSIDWDFNWQGPQEMASRLAKAGNRVCFIENTGIRAPGLKDAGRVVRRCRAWLGAFGSHGLRRVQPNLYVHSPLVLPPFGASWGRRLNAKLFLKQVRRAVKSLGMRDVLLLCYLPTDTALDLIEMLRTLQSVVVYYRVDNLALLTPHAERLRHSEAAVIASSDLVFANSPALAELPLRTHRHVHVFPPSVNLEAFTPTDETRAAAAVTVETAAYTPVGNGLHRGSEGSRDGRLARPVIGYVGAITEHVNQPLVTALARLRPDWSWVFVGPCHTTLDELRRLPNVHFMGQQPHSELVKFIREFDVCIIPYKLSAYTTTVVPTKLNEYLAVGKPVVSANLPAVRSFNEEHDILLTSDEQPGCFLRAIEEALQLPQDGATVARRRAVAASGDWQMRIEAMSQLFEAALETKQQPARSQRANDLTTSASAMKAPRVLISVLSHNSAPTTLTALRCLSQQTYPAYHLQLVDNASADGTPDEAARAFPGLCIKVLPENTGYTGGCNLILRQARAEGYNFVLLCTHDVEVDERAVEQLVETALACPGAGIIGAVEQSLAADATRAGDGGRYSKWFSRAVWQSANGPDALREVFCVHGALLLLTPRALAADVMMDENLFMYFDETDLGFQLQQKNLSAVVDRRVCMQHTGGARAYTPPIGYLMQRNRLYMVRKHGRWYQRAFYVLYSSLIELPLKVTVRALQGHTAFACACVAGQIDGLLGRMGAGRLQRYTRRSLADEQP
ncbi:MAG TPA: glycosyltransferase [Pyrinomonadaceae bacterium]|jgi:GT2 family glycosyltransferase/glycosyltransferase involved in cell wall biosynthesis|nr:glycosyltransferase [Pyrinomonadaceae bacterium]